MQMNAFGRSRAITIITCISFLKVPFYKFNSTVTGTLKIVKQYFHHLQVQQIFLPSVGNI